MRVYTLVYISNDGEKCKEQFEVPTIVEAITIAQNYCKTNDIQIAYLYSPIGKRYLI